MEPHRISGTLRVPVMHMNRNEAGFSLIKMFLVLAILAGAVSAAYRIIPVYNTYWKVQDTFDSVAHNLSDRSESEIRIRLPDLLHVQYVNRSDLPKAFYDNLEIKADGGRVEISSRYHVSVWLLGKPERAPDQDEQAGSEPQGLDKWRNKARLDFDFHPHAETP